MELLSTWLVPHSTPNGLSSFDTIGLPFVPNLTWIWFLLPEHHNLLKRSPTTDVASNQSSQLAHPSYLSNPALMDDSNLPSLHVDTNSLPTPTRGRRRRREPSPSPPLSPASSTPGQRPCTHTYASHFLSTLPSPLPHDPTYFCAIMILMNSLSIKIFTSFGMEKLWENYGEVFESPPISVESDGPNDTDIIILLFKRFHKKKPLSWKANHRLLPSKPSKRNINHQQESQISFSYFLRTPLRPVLIELWMLPVTKQMKMSSPKNRHGLTGNLFLYAAQKQKSLHLTKGYSDTALVPLNRD